MFGSFSLFCVVCR